LGVLVIELVNIVPHLEFSDSLKAAIFEAFAEYFLEFPLELFIEEPVPNFGHFSFRESLRYLHELDEPLPVDLISVVVDAMLLEKSFPEPVKLSLELLVIELLEIIQVEDIPGLVFLK
jgi:hypothetical protein